MDARELLEELRRRPANVRPEELVRLAEMAGWQVRVGAKHRYMLERRGFFPVAVPKHGGRALKKGTVLRILAVIEASLNR
ncbi:hypothetical protein HRbin24_01347 [bacterium HR24]|nr:hypothetical protein HRbin24_01347 [bacterium HR24]